MHFVRRHAPLLIALLPALVLALSLPTGLRAQSTTPAVNQPLPDQSLAITTGATTVDLRKYFSLPGVTGPVAQFDTVLGKFNVELHRSAAPLSVENFLSYVSEGRYDRTIIHRSVALGADHVSNGIVQGGGYTAAVPPVATVKKSAIPLEYNLPNVRGTIAMARTSDLNSATSEWFFNTGNNTDVLGTANAGGYAVFGRVLGTGMTVVDAIAAVPIYNAGSPFDTIPLRNVTANQASVEVANLIVVSSIAEIPVYPAAAGGTAVLAFTVSNTSPAVVAATLSGSTLTLTPTGAGTATVTITASDTNNNTANGTFNVTVAAATSKPIITAQPQKQIQMVSGTVNTVVFTVVATGTPAPTYQWTRNGNYVFGQRGPTYVLTNASDAQAGRFTCVVSNDIGSVESEAAVLSFVPAASPGRLINLSILTGLGSGESMTMGTVLGGTGTSGTKALLARAAGPSLTQLGVTGVLPDPKMSLAGPAGSILGENNDWGGTTALINAFAQVGAFSYGSSTKDAAIFQPSLAPASYPAGYTVQVSDAGTGAGTVIAELYDSTPAASFTPTTSRLINVSVLKQIATGSSLTAGFVIGGTTAKTVLVRAMGPSLALFSLTDFMVDPQLALFNGSSVKIAENDNWGGDAQLTSVGKSVGAFDPSSGGSKDAMLVLTLAPGNYTAQVSGNAGGGRALVEVYEVP